VRAETTPSGGRVVGVAVKSPWLRDRRSLAAVAVALIAVIACAILAMRLGTARADARRNVVFAPKTFDPQAIFTARFAGDGQTIVFSAARGAPPSHLRH
jgi:hypothetical protein